MEHLLLLSNGTVIGIAAGAAGALVFFTLLYGALRKFTRLTWIGLQVPIAFCLLLLADFVPETGNALLDFGIRMGSLFLAAVIPLVLEAIVRGAMYSPKRRPAGKGARVCNRIFGAITSLLALVMLFVVTGAFSLKAIEVSPMGGALSALFSNPIWEFLGAHAVDLLLVSLFMLFIRAGYRLGLLKALFYLLMIALTFAAVAGSILFTAELGFMRTFAGIVAGAFRSLHHAVASTLGFAIVCFLVFLVFFAVVILIGAFVNFLIKKINSVRAIAFIDGLIVCLIYTAVFAVFVLTVFFGAYVLESGGGSLSGTLSSLGGMMEGFGRGMADLFTSSPIAKVIYENNPLMLIFG